MTDRAELALFPLSLVLLPGEIVPLHIFEERYKKLFAELEDGGEFGLVLIEQQGLHEVGCSARLVRVLERLDDGRLNVLIQGSRRFRLLELREPDDLEAECFTGLVEHVDDEDLEAPPDLEASVLRTLRGVLALMNVDATDEFSGEGPLSYRIAAAVDFGVSLKQQLLELLSERQRLEALLTAMTALVPQLEQASKRQEAIRGNGKGR